MKTLSTGKFQIHLRNLGQHAFDFVITVKRKCLSNKTLNDLK